MTAETAKFRDYVTSGAFKLSLSRLQAQILANLGAAQSFLKGGD